MQNVVALLIYRFADVYYDKCRIRSEINSLAYPFRPYGLHFHFGQVFICLNLGTYYFHFAITNYTMKIHKLLSCNLKRNNKLQNKIYVVSSFSYYKNHSLIFTYFLKEVIKYNMAFTFYVLRYLSETGNNVTLSGI